MPSFNAASAQNAPKKAASDSDDLTFFDARWVVGGFRCSRKGKGGGAKKQKQRVRAAQRRLKVLQPAKGKSWLSMQSEKKINI